MRKIIYIASISAVLIMLFTACASITSQNSEDKTDIICTVFPQFDWLKHIIGDNSDNITLSLLLENGVDIHSYNPSAKDILEIKTCDILVCVGGESDSWIFDALENTEKKPVVIKLLDLVGDALKEEELKDGMEDEECEYEHEHEHESEKEYDEHVWLSIKNAITICNALNIRLSEILPANADTFGRNTSAYISELTLLDSKYTDAVNSSDKKVLLFGDRFPFRYLTDDYGLDYYAAFVGCSAETEASLKTIIFLASKADELKLSSILVLDGSDKKLANTVIQNTANKDASILVLNSMQSVKSKDITDGISYISIMSDNLDVITQALK